MRDGREGDTSGREGDLSDVDEPVYGTVHGFCSLRARVACSCGDRTEEDGGGERGTRWCKRLWVERAGIKPIKGLYSLSNTAIEAGHKAPSYRLISDSFKGRIEGSVAGTDP